MAAEMCTKNCMLMCASAFAYLLGSYVPIEPRRPPGPAPDATSCRGVGSPLRPPRALASLIFCGHLRCPLSRTRARTAAAR
jgi:hypothetical protein